MEKQKILIDEDDRFRYYETHTNGCVFRHVEDKVFPEEKLPNNIFEKIAEWIRNENGMD